MKSIVVDHCCFECHRPAKYNVEDYRANPETIKLWPDGIRFIPARSIWLCKAHKRDGMEIVGQPPKGYLYAPETAGERERMRQINQEREDLRFEGCDSRVRKLILEHDPLDQIDLISYLTDEQGERMKQIEIELFRLASDSSVIWPGWDLLKKDLKRLCDDSK